MNNNPKYVGPFETLRSQQIELAELWSGATSNSTRGLVVYEAGRRSYDEDELPAIPSLRAFWRKKKYVAMDFAIGHRRCRQGGFGFGINLPGVGPPCFFFRSAKG